VFLPFVVRLAKRLWQPKRWNHSAMVKSQRMRAAQISEECFFQQRCCDVLSGESDDITICVQVVGEDGFQAVEHKCLS
jgi:hypothetical protein